GPLCIGTDADIAAGVDDATCGGLEEKFGTHGGVDPIVEAAATGVLGFFHARASAAEVGDAGSPDFLRADGREEIGEARCSDDCGIPDRRYEGRRILAADEVVEAGSESVKLGVLFDQQAARG